MSSILAAFGPRRLFGLRVPALGGLWAHRDFVRLFTAQSISLFGSEITYVALPLTAVIVLGASPSQMGILLAAERVPHLLVGLLAGVWVDRLRCRSVLVAADFGRAVLLGSIPLAALFGVLRIEQLLIVAFLAGVLTVFFDVAYHSYLPELVERKQLTEGNAKLEASKSVAEMAGPILGSALLQVAAAPFLISLDALSFVFSGAFLRSIRTNAPPIARSTGAGVLADVIDGIQLVLRHSLLRPLAGCSATMNFFYQMMLAIYVLYITRELELPPTLVGIVFGIGSLGALLGAVVASPAARRFGTGRTLLGGTLLSGLGGLIIAFAHASGLGTLPTLIAAQLLLIVGIPIYNINQVSLRQAITPAGVRGRVNATVRFLVWGTMPVGALLGGYLGETIGLQPTMMLGAIGMVLAGLWVITSRLRDLTPASIAALSEIASP